MKSGLRTTEFWMSLAAKVIGVLAGLSVGGKIGMGIAAVSAVFVTLGYTAARAKVKVSETPKQLT